MVRYWFFALWQFSQLGAFLCGVCIFFLSKTWSFLFVRMACCATACVCVCVVISYFPQMWLPQPAERCCRSGGMQTWLPALQGWKTIGQWCCTTGSSGNPSPMQWFDIWLKKHDTLVQFSQIFLSFWFNHLAPTSLQHCAPTCARVDPQSGLEGTPGRTQ